MVQSVAPPPDALSKPCGLIAVAGPPKAPALMAPLSITLASAQMGASSSTQTVNLQAGATRKLRQELAEQEARAQRKYEEPRGDEGISFLVQAS